MAVRALTRVLHSSPPVQLQASALTALIALTAQGSHSTSRVAFLSGDEQSTVMVAAAVLLVPEGWLGGI